MRCFRKSGALRWGQAASRITAANFDIECVCKKTQYFSMILDYNEKLTEHIWVSDQTWWVSDFDTNHDFPPGCPKFPEHQGEPDLPKFPTAGAQCSPWTQPGIAWQKVTHKVCLLKTYFMEFCHISKLTIFGLCVFLRVSLRLGSKNKKGVTRGSSKCFVS